MKNYIFIFTFILILYGCKKQQDYNINPPFSANLEKIILDEKDSLKVKEDELLSIEFYHIDITAPNYEAREKYPNLPFYIN